MKKFRFCYSTTVWILLAIVIALSAVGLAWNIFNIISVLQTGGYKVMTYSIIIALTAFLLIFAISIAVYGRYVIKDGYIFSYFGFVKSKISISDVVEITHFKRSDKLVVYFKDGSYSVVVISPDLYDDFVLSIREINKAIIFDVKIDGEDTPD